MPAGTSRAGFGVGTTGVLAVGTSRLHAIEVALPPPLNSTGPVSSPVTCTSRRRSPTPASQIRQPPQPWATAGIRSPRAPVFSGRRDIVWLSRGIAMKRSPAIAIRFLRHWPAVSPQLCSGPILPSLTAARTLLPSTGTCARRWTGSASPAWRSASCSGTGSCTCKALDRRESRDRR
jgi:hypothetical protein